jgi:hypothetical protein
MRTPLAVFLSLWVFFCLGTAPLARAGTNDISKVIESFVIGQFPDAYRHFWVVNGFQWQEENELVVDVNAIAFKTSEQMPSENRYLLLIVSGKLVGAQHIPLDEAAVCRPEQS